MLLFNIIIKMYFSISSWRDIIYLEIREMIRKYEYYLVYISLKVNFCAVSVYYRITYITGIFMESFIGE